MNADSTLNKSGSFILSQLGYSHREIRQKGQGAPAITISQRAGSGAHTIAEHLAKLLHQPQPSDSPQWKVFDRQLVEKALEEHDLPKRLAHHMREDRRTYVEDVVDEVLGLRPPSWILVPQIVETIEQILEAGHAIVVGRGSSAIASEMKGIFHVRLVASLAKRIERMQTVHSLTPQEAARFVEAEDRGSRRYARAYFHADIEDEMLYHLVINTDRIPYLDAARLIADEAHRCFERMKQTADPEHHNG